MSGQEPTEKLGLAAAEAALAMENFLKYYQRPSKHRAGHAGQKAKALARRRGLYGKAKRRRELKAEQAERKTRSAWAKRTRVVIAGNHAEYLQWRHEQGIKPADRSVVYASSAETLRDHTAGLIEVVTTGTWLQRKDLQEIAQTVSLLQIMAGAK